MRTGWAFFLAAAVVLAPRSSRAQAAGLEAIFEKVDPAVVTVKVAVEKGASSGEAGGGSIGAGTGAGILVHKDGFVVTAAHVVELASQIVVEFRDGTQVAAQIVSLSRSEDCALLKVEGVPKGVVAPPLADSDKLKVGQPVFTIGAPLGLPHTLTSGLVSAIRDEPSPSGLKPRRMLQTDAAINQGNSGGALFNLRGEIIGIASFIATLSGGSMGLGFAVPSNAVKRRLLNNPIPWLGASLRPLGAEATALFNWPYPGVLLVERVRPDSPMAKAGIRGGIAESTVGESTVLLGGDVIVQVNDWAASDLDAIGKQLQTLKAGDMVRYRVMRKGEVFLAEVEVPALVKLPKF